MTGWQWHQLDHMQIICTSLQTDNHASTTPLSFLQADYPSCPPANSIEELKTTMQMYFYYCFEYIDWWTCLSCPQPAPFRAQNCSFTCGSGPSSNTWFFGPSKSTCQTAYRSVQPTERQTMLLCQATSHI